MKGMKAVLYPIWRIDAIFEGGVEAERTRKEKEAFFAVEEAYVPGNPFAPLSYLSFAVPPLEDHLEPYRPDTDLKQLGEGFEVVPVPFTVSPIGLLDRVRSEVGSRQTYQGIKFDERQWKEKLVRTRRPGICEADDTARHVPRNVPNLYRRIRAQNGS